MKQLSASVYMCSGGMTAFGFAHDVYLWPAGLHIQQGRLLRPLLQCSQCAGTGGLAHAGMDQLAASGMSAATGRNLSTAWPCLLQLALVCICCFSKFEEYQLALHVTACLCLFTWQVPHLYLTALFDDIPI